MEKTGKMMFISFLVTLILLFGGFWGYQQYLIKKPIIAFLEKQQEVQLHDIHVSPSKVQLNLKVANLEQDFLIRKYPDLLTELKQKAKGKPLQVHLADHPNERLNLAWNQMVFGIREGIALQTYTLIPQTVKKWADENGIQYCLNIDEKSVYIMLRDGDDFLIRIVPVNMQTQKGGELFD
ncbi:hypothetical protein [Thermoactinomyces mirandus]|uniref:Uncharacterized protein n=1 Tax=Thermoactinomyces mirandus TaxID=2756294 RepID=A0A7W2ARH9_9BACL|nr:hypothetical protein [Thermoactinomyces mirandus]MBA4602603.1 hypothetical protein [Thermoactinomyces mirandus]